LTTRFQPPDYNNLLDQQMLEFIQQTDIWYPANTIDLTLEQQRTIYNTMCREFHNGYPDNITATDSLIATDNQPIPVRRYTNNTTTSSTRIIYFHGGGFVVGGLESHDDICAELCHTTGIDVSSIDYRLAPEHLHPAAFEDALAAVSHESIQYQRDVLLCGDSAGANLAAAVSHEARKSSCTDINIRAQVLIYPDLGGLTTEGSFITHAQAPMLSSREVQHYRNIRTGGNEATNITTIAPLKDTDFSNLPETIVFSAECDPLCEDGYHYCKAINDAGGKAQWVKENGLIHGYLRARHTAGKAQDSFKRIVSALSDLGRRN